MALLLVTCLVGFFSTSAADVIIRHERAEVAVKDHRRADATVSADGDVNMLAEPMQDLKEIEACHYHFMLGKVGTNECDDPATQKVVTDRELCEIAATEAGMHVIKDRFNLGADWFDKHPAGCFKVPCTYDVNGTTTTGTCYFHNGASFLPTGTLDGQPVCSRPRLLNGTKDSSDCGEPNYELLMSEPECRSAAECWGKCLGHPQFRIDIDNSSVYDDHPKGCFIKKEDDCLYFNTPIPGLSGADANTPPKRPLGTPLCVASGDVSGATSDGITGHIDTTNDAAAATANATATADGSDGAATADGSDGAADATR